MYICKLALRNFVNFCFPVSLIHFNAWNTYEVKRIVITNKRRKI